MNSSLPQAMGLEVSTLISPVLFFKMLAEHCRSRVQCQSFEYLGAAFGGVAFGESYPCKTVDKAQPLLDALGDLDEPQVVLRPPRHCAGFLKVV